MLTRIQVARRLRRSIATVRRIEGLYLHPVVDWRGVHRFYPDEVRSLAQDLRDGLVSLPIGLNPGPRLATHNGERVAPPEELVRLQCEVQRLTADRESLRAMIRGLRALLVVACPTIFRDAAGRELMKVLREMA
jgi:hypothetical protein